MRRLAAIAGLAALLAAAVASAGALHGGDDATRYTIELDNAFGLVDGADLKVAGVRAGTIERMRVDRESKRALVDVKIDKVGFGSLRRDAFCESRPQSLIGEYYIDCLPGRAREELPPGSTIGVEQTASTIPVDLVQNIMRRPQRERLRLILNELGAGVGARAEDIDALVRRGVPALRETNRVLATLGRQNRVLADLVRDGDEVIEALARNKGDVSRWIRETRETAAASAERRAAIAASLRRLPEFLRELRPTMSELGGVAEAQIPSLEDLHASAGQLERLFDNLEPFSRSSQANLRSLGEAADEGLPAMRAAGPVVEELDRFARRTPEVANNLAIILRDLDDRDRAVEPDPRSPGGRGYTGFEALLQYVFDQALAINIYNSNGYILKANLYFSECSEYQSAESLKEHMAEDPEFYERCASILGPSQQGVLQPDPTANEDHGDTSRRKARDRRDRDPARDRPARGKREASPGDDGPSPDRDSVAPPIDLGQTLEDLLGGRVPDIRSVPEAPAPQPASRDDLMDFLFGR